jgi:hypothetical protein
MLRRRRVTRHVGYSSLDQLHKQYLRSCTTSRLLATQPDFPRKLRPCEIVPRETLNWDGRDDDGESGGSIIPLSVLLEPLLANKMKWPEQLTAPVTDVVA